jgi:hypothetical protein
MSLIERVESLKAKHAALDLELQRLNRRPAPDTVRLFQLKRKKLQIKDELERIADH